LLADFSAASTRYRGFPALGNGLKQNGHRRVLFVIKSQVAFFLYIFIFSVVDLKRDKGEENNRVEGK
jgi:hypothetical protein